MKKMVIILCCLLAVSCNTKNTAENVPASQNEFPTKSETIWTDKTELFVEFPALVVNEPSRFATHVTILNDHVPVAEGEVTVNLVKNGEVVESNTASRPSSKGIFTPTITPKSQGNFQLIFDIKTPDFNDKVIIEDVIVYSSKAIAIEALGLGAEAGGISFLKEQAWKMDFQTQVVSRGEIYDVINTSGVWKTSTKGSKTLAATNSGVIEYQIENLTDGVQVKRGQLLMSISTKGMVGNNLNSEIQKAKATFDQANAEYERKKELFDSKIVSKAEFEKVESNYLVAKSNYEALTSGVSGGSKQLKAPFDGFVKKIHVNNGDFVDQGNTIIEITGQNSRVLETQVNAGYSLDETQISDIWYRYRENDWESVKETGKILSVGKNVDASNPLVSVFAEVNSGEQLLLGGFSEVQIGINKVSKAIVVPETSLLENYGSYSVIVQLSGETFERRDVTIGKQNGTTVEITSGLSVGDVVVTKGAYQVKMASMSGVVPDHGHEH